MQAETDVYMLLQNECMIRYSSIDYSSDGLFQFLPRFRFLFLANYFFAFLRQENVPPFILSIFTVIFVQFSFLLFSPNKCSRSLYWYWYKKFPWEDISIFSVFLSSASRNGRNFFYYFLSFFVLCAPRFTAYLQKLSTFPYFHFFTKALPSSSSSWSFCVKGLLSSNGFADPFCTSFFSEKL